MWTAVVHVPNNVRMDRDVTVNQTVLAASAHRISVKVNAVTDSVKYLSLNILAPTCNDGIKNGDETDKDCGGPCLPAKRCGELLKCVNPSDCTTGACVSNICQGKCS